MTTMSFSDLWKYFKFLSDPQSLSAEHRSFLQSFLAQELRLREEKRIQYLLRSSGIKRIKRLIDFDWTFNPKIPRDKIMEFLHCVFRAIPATDSTPFRPPIPLHPGH